MTAPGALPEWIQYVQAFGPVLIGAAVATVAALQWRTAEAQKRIARDKLLLDLFEKRFAIYLEVREIVDGTTFTKVGDYDALKDVIGRARFLFGTPIIVRLEAIRRLLHEKASGRLPPGGALEVRTEFQMLTTGWAPTCSCIRPSTTSAD